METEILQNLKQAVIDLDPAAAKEWAQKAVADAVDPIKSLDALTEAIRKVGDDFESGEVWLPDLVGAADALQAAMPIIEEDIKRRGAVRESLGIVVIGTVKGDIHTIGKMMVSTFLTAAGFSVYDVGVDVDAQKFMDAVKEYKAQVLAMSALLSFTAPEQKRVIQALEEAGIRDSVKVIVGGGAITGGFAENIGADGYSPAAPGAVGLVKGLLGIE
jgi:methanogenic corrinoid protein MtbC1